MCAVRRRRRGDHAHAGLADAGRADQARRRDAGDRADARARTGSALHADADPRGDHAADARHHHQLARQSDRRADRRGGRSRRSPTRRRRAASGSCSISATSKLIYDPVPHNLRRRAVATHARSHGALRLGVEGLRDDRLALRLGGRARRRSSAPATRSRATRRRTSARSRRRRSTAALNGPQDCVTRDARRVPAPPRPAVRVARGRAAHPAA